MKRLIAFSFIFSTVIIQADLQAEIYKQTLPDGSVVYTDQPPEGADIEKVKLKPAAIIPSVDTSSITSKVNSSSQGGHQQEKASFQVSISSPGSGTHYRNGQADAIPFTYSVSPDLRAPYKIEAALDGKKVNAQSGTLPTLYRGEHTLTVKVIGKSGKAVSTATSTFFVHRFSGG